MTAKKSKKSPVDLRRQFIDQAWDILQKYIEQLAEDSQIKDSDPRTCSTVIKTLLESIDRAGSNLPEEEVEIELPDIPEKAIEEAMRICFPELAPSGNVTKIVRARAGVSDRQAAGVAP